MRAEISRYARNSRGGPGSAAGAPLDLHLRDSTGLVLSKGATRYFLFNIP